MTRSILAILAMSTISFTAACMPGMETPAPGAASAPAQLPLSVVQTGTNEDRSPAYTLSFTEPGVGPGVPNAPVMDRATQDQTMLSVCPGGYTERFRGPVGNGEVRVGFRCS